MSRAILIMGESGSGKTTSLRTLDPQTTLIIDADRKGLSWRGWRKSYNTANKNYIQSSDVSVIMNYLTRVNDGDLTHIEVVVIDTLNMCMIDDEMRRMKEKGYDKWVDLAAVIWELITKIHLYREDLTVVCMAHTQTDRDDSGYIFTRMKTSGRKLDKIVPESKFSTVLISKALDGKYVFETQSDKSTAKSPMGCFDKEIDNDMAAVIAALKEYEGEDAEDTAKSA
ncbi:AAA domain protein [Selenomonas sp. FOBRC9]|uniref:AAA family ATPase n=1 Tax=Selenomonas sp. FOBRC9 TaxID=936573 RepID=UPI00027A603A|nr:AAA family ATPase [Selenomonas sp. FOBRC9]EJP32296.1 AAA domain protein [Selenomonas sp. FOBRC9]